MGQAKKPASVEVDLPTEPMQEIFPVETHNIYVPQKGLPKRRYAIVESPAYFTKDPEQQLMMMTARELEETKKQFPGLIVRWAENEDLAKWKLVGSVFDGDQKAEV